MADLTELRRANLTEMLNLLHQKPRFLIARGEVPPANVIATQRFPIWNEANPHMMPLPYIPPVPIMPVPRPDIQPDVAMEFATDRVLKRFPTDIAEKIKDMARN
jgi:hypothetical protein